MNDSVHNSNSVKSDAVNRKEGHMMPTDSGAGASMMQSLQSTVFTDLGLIYMLQQQQSGGGGGAEAAMMLSQGSLPLLMSSCQVMTLHPGMSHQFVSASSTGTSPSSVAKSPLLAPDGSVVWHHAGTDDQLSDNFDDDHHQGTGFVGQQHSSGGPSQQQPASPASHGTMLLHQNSRVRPSATGAPAVNGACSATSSSYALGHSVLSTASNIAHSGFVAAAAAPQVVLTTHPKPNLVAPKKPLTPYMKFSKSIWQHVKNANPSLSVCEVGASIGRLWREMGEAKKQKYNDEFQREKAVYEADLQNYLQATGLQVSNLSKSKKKDQRDRSKPASNQVAAPAAPSSQSATVNIVATLPSHASAVAVRHDTEDEGARLPHIAQMWSGHSGVMQVDDILKCVYDPFEAGRTRSGEVGVRSLQEHEGNSVPVFVPGISHSSPGGGTVPAEVPAGLQWTWMKTAESVESVRPFPMESVDPAQSAYLQPEASSLSLLGAMTPASDQHAMEFYSSDGLEPGEVVMETPEQPLAKLPAAQNGNVVSAHTMYNSYAVNPWNRYKASTAGHKASDAIFDREHILKTELIHLRGSLSEKTKEVEQLTKELETAYALISKLRQQDLGNQAAYFSGEPDLLHQMQTAESGEVLTVGGEPGEVCSSYGNSTKHMAMRDHESTVKLRETTAMNLESGEKRANKKEVITEDFKLDLKTMPDESEMVVEFSVKLENADSVLQEDGGRSIVEQMEFISEQNEMVAKQQDLYAKQLESTCTEQQMSTAGILQDSVAEQSADDPGVEVQQLPPTREILADSREEWSEEKELLTSDATEITSEKSRQESQECASEQKDFITGQQETDIQQGLQEQKEGQQRKQRIKDEENERQVEEFIPNPQEMVAVEEQNLQLMPAEEPMVEFQQQQQQQPSAMKMTSEETDQ